MPAAVPWVTGFDHQLTGSAAIAFWSTILPVLPWSAQGGRHQPQAWASVIFTVLASGALRPLSWKAGSLAASLFSMFCRKVVVPPAPLLLEGGAPAAFCSAS